jgi:hypothetical protein
MSQNIKGLEVRVPKTSRQQRPEAQNNKTPDARVLNLEDK